MTTASTLNVRDTEESTWARCVCLPFLKGIQMAKSTMRKGQVEKSREKLHFTPCSVLAIKPTPATKKTTAHSVWFLESHSLHSGLSMESLHLSLNYRRVRPGIILGYGNT